ncbi:zinc finger and BTB domain-containing protein 5 [Grus japonensis]|uniref:Zinc finger and BTB domain-containing protein 5 n=1 Tax=Grus japonensis TaxID=30415 RepID=A0ABC9W458_GRUJA
MGKTMVKQAVPLQPMEDDDGAEIPSAAHGGPHAGASGCLKEAVTPWEAQAGASSWQDLWSRGERSPHWSRFAGRTCDPVGDPTLEQSGPEGLHPMEGTHAGAVCEEPQPMGRTHVGEVCGGPHAGAGEECEESSP